MLHQALLKDPNKKLFLLFPLFLFYQCTTQKQSDIYNIKYVNINMKTINTRNQINYFKIFKEKDTIEINGNNFVISSEEKRKLLSKISEFIDIFEPEAFTENKNEYFMMEIETNCGQNININYNTINLLYKNKLFLELEKNLINIKK